MYMIEIETKEMEKASEYAEKALKYMGKVMQCLTEWEEEGGYGSRYGERGGQGSGSYGNRGDYGMRGGYGRRDDDDWDEDEMMGERRRRSRRTGRYM